MAKAILGEIGDKLDNLLKQYTRIKNKSEFYDPTNKKLDLTQLIPAKEFSRLLESVSGANFGNASNLFERFFDISVGRFSRYTDYEQLVYRIPEAAQALQIYVDSILAPNASEKENGINYDFGYGDEHHFETAKILIQNIFQRTNFFNVLPQIIYTALLYGDCFVELDETYSGIRYILHTPKKASIVHDTVTDIELGLVIQMPDSKSKTLEMLSKSFPSLRVNLPKTAISVLSDKKLLTDKKNSLEIEFAKKQIEELVGDLLQTEGSNFKYLAPHKYVKFSIYYNNMYYPYGTSIFDPIRSVAKQLLLIESALAIYRATRTPIRTLWNVEVGSTPDDQIPRLINGIMNRVRRQKVVDSEVGGSIDSIPEMMSLEEDIWSPTISGTPLLKAENIPSGDTTPYVNDAEYFKKKLISGLGIPPAYLAEEQGASTRALLTLEDVRFSRTVKKYQGDINNGLNDLINSCFILLNQSHLTNAVNISLPNPSSIEDNLRIDNIAKRIDIGRSLSENYPNIPKSWILSNIVGFTEDEIEEMREYVEYQKNDDLFVEQIPGKMDASSSISSASAGGGSFGADEFSSDLESGMDFNEEGMEEGNEEELESPLGEIDLGNVAEEVEMPEEIDENL
ncbi:MAG TPA: portal protein [bacterium]|nr:portal protein [bacterium]